MAFLCIDSSSSEKKTSFAEEVFSNLYKSRLENVSSAKEVFFSEQEEAIQKQDILVIEWPELIEPVIDNFWKIEISYAKNYGRHYEIRDPKNLLTFS